MRENPVIASVRLFVGRRHALPGPRSVLVGQAVSPAIRRRFAEANRENRD
jgi:hypothetical protein